MWLTAEVYFCRQVSTNFALFKNKINICNFRINWDKMIILLVLNWHWTLSLLQREVCMCTLYRERLRTGRWGEHAWREEREHFGNWTDLHKFEVCNCYIIPDSVKRKRRKNEMDEMSDGDRLHMGDEVYKLLQKFDLRIFKALTVSKT